MNTSRHILIKLTKIKDKQKILKAAREKKQITYKRTPIRLSADISARLSFRFEEGIQSFTDKQKLREFSNTRPALQQTLKELL